MVNETPGKWGVTLTINDVDEFASGLKHLHVELIIFPIPVNLEKHC